MAAGGDNDETDGGDDEKTGIEYSPWFRLFQNAYAFSMAQQGEAVP